MWTHIPDDGAIAPDEIHVEAGGRAPRGHGRGRRRRDWSSRSWSPVQLVAVAVGVGFVVLGLVVLARTGFSTARMTSHERVVWTLPHTPLLAVVEIAFGSTVIAAAVIPAAARPVLILLGLLAIGVGAAILLDFKSDKLVHWFAVDHRSGLLFVAAGVVTLAVGLASPPVLSRRYRRRWALGRTSIH
jgi:hypothetical protein